MYPQNRFVPYSDYLCVSQSSEGDPGPQGPHQVRRDSKRDANKSQLAAGILCSRVAGHASDRHSRPPLSVRHLFFEPNWNMACPRQADIVTGDLS